MLESEARTIDELCALYEIEPSMRDVFVEGPFDKQFVSWFLKRIGHDSFVRAMGSTIVPDDLVAELGLDIGERGRVIALSQELDKRLLDATKHAVCIADRDFASLSEESLPDSPSLLFTDYASIELYAFRAENIEKLLRVSLAAPSTVTGVDVIEGITSALVDLFLVRGALHRRETGVAMFEGVHRCCSLSSDRQVQVDIGDVVDRSLSSRSWHKKYVMDEIEALREQLPGDRRLTIHAEDVPRLMAIALKPFMQEASALREPAAMRAALLGTIELHELRAERMWSALEERTAAFH